MTNEPENTPLTPGTSPTPKPEQEPENSDPTPPTGTPAKKSTKGTWPTMLCNARIVDVTQPGRATIFMAAPMQYETPKDDNRPPESTNGQALPELFNFGGCVNGIYYDGFKSPADDGHAVPKRTPEQEEFLRDMERIEGRKLTVQEENLHIAQAEMIGDL